MEEYKKAVLAHYEAVKNDLHPDFLLRPTTARIRSLCVLLFDSISVDDKVIFTRFFKANSLNASLNFNDVADFPIDKFKPLVRFMKGGSPPTNLIAIELLAILVDYQPRPLKKFSKVGIKQVELNDESGKVDIHQTADNNKSEEKEKENSSPLISDRKDEEIENDIVPNSQFSQEETDIEDSSTPTKIFVPIEKKPRKDYVKITLIFLLVAIGGGYLAKSDWLKEKGCMIWEQDHYEKVACDYKGDPSEVRKIIPIDETLLNYQKKIKVTDTTRFFNSDGSSRFFYGKNVNQQMEYFTLPGRHPETGKLLKELSDYMIRKHFVSTGN